MPEGTLLAKTDGQAISGDAPKPAPTEPQRSSTENQGGQPENSGADQSENMEISETEHGQNRGTDAMAEARRNTIEHQLRGRFFLIDTHMHVLKFHGNYFRNAKPYKQWAKRFGKRTLVPNTETPPFAGMIDIMHNPRFWFPDNLNPTPNRVRFEVRSGLNFSLPDGKTVGLTIACHPSMAGQDNEGDLPLYTPLAVKTALFQILSQSRTLFGKAIVGIGETGFDWGRKGTPKNEKPPAAQRLMVVDHLEAAKEFCLPLIFHVRGEDLERIKMLHRELFLLMDTHKYPTGDPETDKEHRERLGERYDPTGWPIVLHTFCADQDILDMWTAKYPHTYAGYSKGSLSWPEAKKCLTEYDQHLDHTILESDAPMFDNECNDPNVPRDSEKRNPAHSNQILDILQIIQLSRMQLNPKEVVRRLARNSMQAFRLTDDQIRAGLSADTENEGERRDYKSPSVPKQAAEAQPAAAAAGDKTAPKQKFSQAPALKQEKS
ncbi:hypothetical protein AAVH_33144 [Aphelenchoides avenae]|nr:hypothetical protein AAVH_33144 [Aphelenchus avenae]